MTYQKSLIGCGMKLALLTNATGGVRTNDSMDRINQSLFILFDTRQGSRLMQPDFGTLIHEFRFDPLDEVLITQLDYHIREAIRKWERRVEIIHIDFQDSEVLRENNTLMIAIHYKIINTNVEGNYTYPYQYGPRTIVGG